MTAIALAVSVAISGQTTKSSKSHETIHTDKRSFTEACKSGERIYVKYDVIRSITTVTKEGKGGKVMVDVGRGESFMADGIYDRRYATCVGDGLMVGDTIITYYNDKVK